MNKTIAKLFYSNEYIKVKVVYPSNKVKTFYTIPKDNIIQIKGEKKAFEVQTDKIVYEGKTPVLYYNASNPVPISFHLSEEEEQFLDMNPNKLYSGLENKLVAQFMASFFKPDQLTPSLIVSILTLVLMLGGFVFLYMSIQDLAELINGIWDF